MNRPLCEKCEKNLASKRKNRKGEITYRTTCDSCARTVDAKKQRVIKQDLKRRPWPAYKKDHCERCGFVPEDSCQLDVDHIDGRHDNNDPANYMTLCANCHRLKTKLSGDGWYAYHPKNLEAKG